jgi:hypothetical protein
MKIKKEFNRTSPFRTICEVHREIYDILHPLREKPKFAKAITLLEEAYLMAKKMNDKLFEYKKDWDAGFFKEQDPVKREAKSKLRRSRKNE